MCITSTLTSFCNNINMEAEVFNGQLCSKRNVRNRTGIGRSKHWEHFGSSCTNGFEHGAACGHAPTWVQSSIFGDDFLHY